MRLILIQEKISDDNSEDVVVIDPGVDHADVDPEDKCEDEIGAEAVVVGGNKYPRTTLRMQVTPRMQVTLRILMMR